MLLILPWIQSLQQTRDNPVSGSRSSVRRILIVRTGWMASPRRLYPGAHPGAAGTAAASHHEMSVRYCLRAHRVDDFSVPSSQVNTTSSRRRA